MVKQRCERLAAAVNATLRSSIINIRKCTLQETPLTFYTHFKLFTLIDTSYAPFVQYYILDNGDTAIPLEGKLTSWSTANKIEPPSLNISNILDYAKLVLNTAFIQNKRNHLITSIDDIDFARMPGTSKFQQIESLIKPPVTYKKEGKFVVLSCLIEDGKLYDGTVRISPIGEITITEKNLLLSDIPVDELVWE